MHKLYLLYLVSAPICQPRLLYLSIFSKLSSYFPFKFPFLFVSCLLARGDDRDW